MASLTSLPTELLTEVLTHAVYVHSARRLPLLYRLALALDRFVDGEEVRCTADNATYNLTNVANNPAPTPLAIPLLCWLASDDSADSDEICCTANNATYDLPDVANDSSLLL
ncbi:hypothetical protein CFE70_003143 [Pyrenophora teres f. teres 0-1]